MLLRYMDKLFALQPRANTVEYGVIAAVIGTAVFAILLAFADPIAAACQSLLGHTPDGNITSSLN